MGVLNYLDKNAIDIHSFNENCTMTESHTIWCSGSFDQPFPGHGGQAREDYSGSEEENSFT